MGAETRDSKIEYGILYGQRWVGSNTKWTILSMMIVAENTENAILTFARAVGSNESMEYKILALVEAPNA